MSRKPVKSINFLWGNRENNVDTPSLYKYFYWSVFQFIGHADVGRQFLEPVSNRIDPSSGPGSLNESGLVEPLDYEEYITQQTRMNRGQTKHNNTNDNLLVDFPPDDIEVNVVPRKIRTLGHVLPEEPMYVHI